jgi:hypothetical protein
MFKRLIKRFMSEEKLNGDANLEAKDAEQPQAEASAPGVEVPAGPQMPGVDVNTGKPVNPDGSPVEDEQPAEEAPKEEAPKEAAPDQGDEHVASAPGTAVSGM